MIILVELVLFFSVMKIIFLVVFGCWCIVMMLQQQVNWWFCSVFRLFMFMKCCCCRVGCKSVSGWWCSVKFMVWQLLMIWLFLLGVFNWILLLLCGVVCSRLWLGIVFIVCQSVVCWCLVSLCKVLFVVSVCRVC